nr:hypothetical protein [uncultured Actinoplanes sp.]
MKVIPDGFRFGYNSAMVVNRPPGRCSLVCVDLRTQIFRSGAQFPVCVFRAIWTRIFVFVPMVARLRAACGVVVMTVSPTPAVSPIPAIVPALHTTRGTMPHPAAPLRRPAVAAARPRPVRPPIG